MSKKQQIRREFRLAVFIRARFCCEVCGKKGFDRQGGDDHLKYHKDPEVELDAHHIMDRHDMPNGGYVAENGVSVCSDCHLLAEMDEPPEGYTPQKLYDLIGSSLDEAWKASEELAK